MEKVIRAELGFFESLRERIHTLLEDSKNYGDMMFVTTAKVVLKKYNQEYHKINKLLEFGANEGLQYVAEPHEKTLYDWYAAIYALLPECDKAIEGLKSKSSSLAVEQSLKLKRLKFV